MQDSGDPAVVAFLDTNTRKERQTEKDVFDAYQNLSKFGSNFANIFVFLPCIYFQIGLLFIVSNLCIFILHLHFM